MKRFAIIDAIHDGVARLELADGGWTELPLQRLPAGCREGDVLATVETVVKADAQTGPDWIPELVVDREATAAAARRIRAKLNRLREER
ncbi:DUF3006 domain-containing protein [Spirochaeta africana]|nr:DUF3006 domain-containing protein [Spirochaeta africana]